MELHISEELGTKEDIAVENFTKRWTNIAKCFVGEDIDKCISKHRHHAGGGARGFCVPFSNMQSTLKLRAKVNVCGLWLVRFHPSYVVSFGLQIRFNDCHCYYYSEKQNEPPNPPVKTHKQTNC